MEAEDGKIDANIASGLFYILILLLSDSASFEELSGSFFPDKRLYPLILLFAFDLPVVVPAVVIDVPSLESEALLYD